MLQHYVFIKYLAGTADVIVAEFCTHMLALRGHIGEIEHLEIGRDILHEERSWDVMLNMRFASVAALRRYQRHPEHQRVMAFNQPFVAQVGSVDFPIT